MDWTLSCPRYKALDWFKRTWLASQLIFHGGKFQHFEQITIEGVMLDCEHGATDGDKTFDVRTDILVHGNPSLNWHCEVVPCTQDASLRTLAASLAPGQRVSVSGTRTWDPMHLGHAAHWEVHPATSIVVLHS